MILIKDLNKSFKTRRLFENLNLELPSNKLTFIVGKSGIGKSTLLKLISGYEKQDSGTIDFVGYKNLDFKNIDFVFQDFNLIKGLSALENLQVGVNVLGIKFDKQKAWEILEKIGISLQLSKQKIETLSGGEQQRVAIARSILRNSQILLTDEPTGNLDFENSETIFEYLKEISKTKTVIVVTHDIENAKKFGDYIVEIEEDNILQYYLNNSSENEQQFYNNEIQMPISKINNKAKLLPKFVKNDIKRKIIQLFFLIFAFVATVVAFGTFAQLQNGIQTKITKIKSSYLQLDKVSVQKKALETGGFSVDNPLFSQQDIDKFKSLSNLKYFAKLFDNSSGNVSYNKGNQIHINDYEFIDFNNFYKDRLVDNISIGSFPTNDSEIIISQKLLKRLNIQDPIGKTILFQDDSVKRKLKIAAVNDITTLGGRNLTYISNNFIEKNQESFLSNNDSFSLFTKGINNSFYNGKWSILQNIDPKLISNNNIKVNNDLPLIYLSKNIVDANHLKINDKINSTLSAALGLENQALKITQFRLAGIINTSTKTAAITKDFSKEYVKPSPVGLSLYFNNNVDTANLVKKLMNNPNFSEYKFLSNSSAFAEQFSINMSFTIYVIEIIAGSLFLVSVLFSLVFTKIFNDFKKREIGLLKSLGSSLKQILIYHISYYLMVNLLVLIISMILLVPISNVIILHYPNASNVTFDYSLGFLNMFIIWSINLGITTLIFTLFSYFKFRRKITYLLK